jgi:glycerophosphoryl diester phosphodiesterase
VGLSSQGPSPFPIAHGAGNELELLHRAESLGLPLVEADVHLHRGRLEVRHLKTAGPLPILWDRWRLASPFAPRLVLAELLAAAAPQTELLLDLKGRDLRLAEGTLETLERHPRGSVTVSARDWRLLEPFRDLGGIRRLGSIGRAYQLRGVERRLDAAALDGLSVQRRLLSPHRVAHLRSLVPTVVTWPVDSVGDARTLSAWGVTGVITADLGLAHELMRNGRESGEQVPGEVSG